jgi:hypothetical protein
MPKSVNDRNRAALAAQDLNDMAAATGATLAVGETGGGGGAGFPFDASAGLLHASGSINSTVAQVRLSHACGAESLLRITDPAHATLRILGCRDATTGKRSGWELTEDGLRAVVVDTDENGDETTEEDPERTLLPTLQVNACVNGVTKTLVLYGMVKPT